MILCGALGASVTLSRRHAPGERLAIRSRSGAACDAVRAELPVRLQTNNGGRVLYHWIFISIVNGIFMNIQLIHEGVFVNSGDLDFRMSGGCLANWPANEW
ncbi:hypothetical protein [Burkholderia sp. ABCPW 14]|uniref:hypothetical protein n=1 Tax=Burkholderia sp. ABCPW 14 TaxID=1637860 RepID=UPI0012E3375F|nr:hypothetical protein [Burkholderia sp. ABCPW 14]